MSTARRPPTSRAEFAATAAGLKPQTTIPLCVGSESPSRNVAERDVLCESNDPGCEDGRGEWVRRVDAAEDDYCEDEVLGGESVQRPEIMEVFENIYLRRRTRLGRRNPGGHLS